MEKKDTWNITAAVILFIAVVGIFIYLAAQSPDEVSRTLCTLSDRNVNACIEIYSPVCGWASENKLLQTYSNSCTACLNENVTFYTEGECT